MDKSARMTGMTVFIVGILVLLFVFFTAYMMFNAPSAKILPGEEVTTAVDLAKSLTAVLVKIVLLFIMTLAGSLVAARGIQLYFGGKA